MPVKLSAQCPVLNSRPQYHVNVLGLGFGVKSHLQGPAAVEATFTSLISKKFWVAVRKVNKNRLQSFASYVDTLLEMRSEHTGINRVVCCCQQSRKDLGFKNVMFQAEVSAVIR